MSARITAMFMAFLAACCWIAAWALCMSDDPMSSLWLWLGGIVCVGLAIWAARDGDYRPYVPSEWEEQLAEAARTRRKDRTRA